MQKVIMAGSDLHYHMPATISVALIPIQVAGPTVKTSCPDILSFKDVGNLALPPKINVLHPNRTR